MKADANARTILSSATANHHRRVDDTFSAFALGDPASYGLFLRAQAVAHLPVEDALAAGGIAAIVRDWSARRRYKQLRLDLAELRLNVPTPVGSIALEGTPALLGALYVLEGSRLGGALLRKRVAPDLPTRFLDKADPTAWRTLLSLLETELDTDLKRGSAVAAAKAVFDLFEAGGRLGLEPGKPA